MAHANQSDINKAAEILMDVAERQNTVLFVDVQNDAGLKTGLILCIPVDAMGSRETLEALRDCIVKAVKEYQE